ncbi:MAG: nuclear transport factor 2 family protein [Sphingomonadales bacterium]|nr:nuclear transport factor 2 family protein [Sphingomonadales bacterium]
MAEALTERVQGACYPPSRNDKDAIRELIARYGLMADPGDASGVADLWSKAAYSVGGVAEAKGQAAIAMLIDGEMHQSSCKGCAHLLGPVAIVLDGDAAIARGHGVVFFRDESGYRVWRVSANRWELIRTPDGWRVSRRVNAPLDGSGEARQLLGFGDRSDNGQTLKVESHEELNAPKSRATVSLRVDRHRL